MNYESERNKKNFQWGHTFNGARVSNFTSTIMTAQADTHSHTYIGTTELITHTHLCRIQFQ